MKVHGHSFMDTGLVASRAAKHEYFQEIGPVSKILDMWDTSLPLQGVAQLEEIEEQS